MRWFVAFLFWLPPAATFAGPEIADLPQIPRETRTTLYVSNRDPLAVSPLVKLPIGAISPRGWLRHMLELQAAGMSGQLEQISPWCKFEGNAWTDAHGAGRNGWEEVPYWLKGYGDLGYVLQDDTICAEAKRWIGAILATQTSDGWFGPAGLKVSLDGRPDLWPNMAMLSALQSYYEFSGDSRILKLMRGYLRWELDSPAVSFSAGYWPRFRTADNLQSVYWLYNRTGEKWLLDLATKIHTQSPDWVHTVPNWHGVNLTQGFREPAIYSQQARDPALFAGSVHVYDEVMGTYGQFPGGGFAADENCRPGYGDPRQGFETCSIVEFMNSFEQLTNISGSPIWADRCEDLAFNTLPAALTPDLKGLHYLTCANAVQLDPENKSPDVQNQGTMLSYSPYAVYRCCQHNHGMGWPYFAENLWQATSDGGLCASMYAACDVTAKAAGEMPVTIGETTDYPFDSSIKLRLALTAPVEFPLYLRVPGWCTGAAVRVNDVSLPLKATPDSYIVLRQTWKNGDRVELQLSSTVSIHTWQKNGDAVSVSDGPLTFSLDIEQRWQRCGGTDRWPEWAVYPASPWNYGLVLDTKGQLPDGKIVRTAAVLPDQPFARETTPVQLQVAARRIPNWKQDSLGMVQALQPSPIRSDEPLETVTLIPMGAARLRICSFPTVSQSADAHVWQTPTTQTADAH